MTILASIRRKIAALEAQAKQIEVARKPGVAQVTALVKKYKLTAGDLRVAFAAVRGKGGARGRRVSKLAGKKVPVKYRDKKGNRWSGRGQTPRWLREAEAAGVKREEFLVNR